MARKDPNRIVSCKFCTKHLSLKGILRHCRSKHWDEAPVGSLKTKDCYVELTEDDQTN